MLTVHDAQTCDVWVSVILQKVLGLNQVADWADIVERVEAQLLSWLLSIYVLAQSL